MIKFYLFFLIPFFIVNISQSAESDQSHWLNHTQEALDYTGLEYFDGSELNLEGISIHTNGDYAVYHLEHETGDFSVQCHSHSEEHMHCLNVVEGEVVPESFSEVLSLSGQELYQFFESINLNPASIDPSLWPWVLGAVATYYFAKKLLNLWIYKSFTIKENPHDHSHFFMTKEEIKKGIKSTIHQNEQKFSLIKDFHSQNKLEKNKAKLLEAFKAKLLALTAETLENFKHSSCSSCGHDHHDHGHHDHNHQGHDHQHKQNHDHGHGQGHHHHDHHSHTASNFVINSLGLATSLAALTAYQPQSIQFENPFLNLEGSKKIVKEGLILKYTKAFLLDLKSEFVDPLKRVFSGISKIFADKNNRGQLNSLIQTRYRVFVGETNWIAASSIALSLASIKVLGETVESAFLGPYHILCQVTDAAVVAVGLTLFSTYHCLRQPLRKRSFSLFFKRKYWSVLFKRLKDPFKKDIAKNANSDANVVDLLINELYTTKKGLEKFIQLLRNDEQLDSQNANSLAKALGTINKTLEEKVFDAQLESSSSMSDEKIYELSQELLSVADSYARLYYSILEEVREQSLIPSQMNLCRGLLSSL